MTDRPVPPEIPPPPAHVEPYVRLLGAEAAIAFLLAYGGSELYLPQRGAPPAQLSDLVGAEAAARLCAAGPRLSRRVPTAKPWLAAVFASRGLSVAGIARTLHVTDVTVRGWLKRQPHLRRAAAADPRQLPLI